MHEVLLPVAYDPGTLLTFIEPSPAGHAIPGGHNVHSDWLPRENVPNSQGRMANELQKGVQVICTVFSV